VRGARGNCWGLIWFLSPTALLGLRICLSSPAEPDCDGVRIFTCNHDTDLSTISVQRLLAFHSCKGILAFTSVRMTGMKI
jgi:hypothetical protein